MTIKQHGGIFGRNPTFNDVTITDIEVTGTSNLTGNVGIGTAPSTEALTVAGKITSTTSGYTVNSTYPLFGYYNVGPVGYVQAPVAGNFEVWADSTGAIAKFKDNLDVEIVSGNLVIGTSGKGIDFSATSDGSGTSTSELFDDYEEGDFTPTYVASTTDYDSITYGYQLGKYVKIGRMVHCTIEIRTMGVTVGSGAGYIEIHGLPYANSSSGGTAACVRFGVATAFAGGSIESVRTRAGEAALSITDTANNSIAASNIGTGTYANQIHLTFAYQTA